MSGPIRESSCEEIFAGISDEIETASKYLPIFIDEAELSLDDISDTLLAMEGGGSEEELKLLLVTSHRIKGSAASVGLNRTAKLAHLMEDLLQQLVGGGGTMTPELTDSMLKCTDGIRSHVDGLKRGSPGEDRFVQLANELSAAQAAAGGSENAGDTKDDNAARKLAYGGQANAGGQSAPNENLGKAAISDALRSRVAEFVPADTNTLLGVVAFRPDLMLSGMKAQLIYEKLLNLGEVCYLHPSADELENMESISEISFALVTDKSPPSVSQYIKVAGVADIAIEPFGDISASSDAGTKPAAENKPLPSGPPNETTTDKPAANASGGLKTSNRPNQTLRVDIGRLDQLMNLAGQLVINKARFSQIGDSLRPISGGNKTSRALSNASLVLDKMLASRPVPQGEQALRRELEFYRSRARRVQNELEIVRREAEVISIARNSVTDLMDTIHQLDRVSDGIQKSVMDTRMVPIGPLFNRFKRVVRDIARSNGKNIRLRITGENTELDKRVVDELGDPLIHMVRNSADHGIENPDAREAAGKPREGTISLSAFQQGSSIIVQAADDGRGMDIKGIAEKAVQKGFVSASDVHGMSDHHIAQLVWEAGLTTAEKVTEVSGRGMGMDIVKSKIEELNGSMELTTSSGKGTTITIKLPLTLAILPSLMVRIDGDILAMPMESVSEIAAVGWQAVKTMHGKRVAEIRGRAVSIVNVGEVFVWNNANKPFDDGRQTENVESETADTGELTVVVVEAAGREVGLVVDRVIGEEDIVIKSMADNYRNVAGIAGASILGDGRVSLILDIVALVEMATKN